MTHLSSADGALVDNGNAGGQPQRGARVSEVGIGLDLRGRRQERVALRLGDVELRGRADLVAIDRELRGSLGRSRAARARRGSWRCRPRTR